MILIVFNIAINSRTAYPYPNSGKLYMRWFSTICPSLVKNDDIILSTAKLEYAVKTIGIHAATDTTKSASSSDGWVLERRVSRRRTGPAIAIAAHICHGVALVWSIWVVTSTTPAPDTKGMMEHRRRIPKKVRYIVGCPTTDTAQSLLMITGHGCLPCPQLP